MPNPTVPAAAPGLPAAPESIAVFPTMLDRMENSLHEVRDLAHAVFIIAGAMPWDEAQATQRLAGLIMDRAEELKQQRTAMLEALHSPPASAGEASHG